MDRQYTVLGLGLSHWILLLYYRVGIYCCGVITLDNAVVSYLLMSSQWTVLVFCFDFDCTIGVFCVFVDF